MTVAEITLEYLEVLVWPVTLCIILLAYRGQFFSLLQKSKIKISLYGVEIETTIPELEATTLAALGGNLDSNQFAFLSASRMM